MNEIKLFCPASVANVSCGFDVLGFCLKPIGDEMVIRKTSKKGIHIIDIRNVSNPINIGFITLPGNYDLATKGDYLYADSYLDLVVFDISNINSITEVNRLKNNFDNYYLGQGLYDEDQGVIVGYKEELKEEYIENHDCGLAYD